MKKNPLMPTPHAGQRQILALPGRFIVAICGRRFGKNVVGSILAERAAHNGKIVLWIEPTEDQARDVEYDFINYLKTDIVEHTGDDEKNWKHFRTDREIRHFSGGRIRFRSAQVRNALRGRGLDLVVLDEAADIEEDVWKLVILPQLLERNGRAIMLGTPRGKGNWLHKIFEEAANKKAWSRYHAPTSKNPLITVKQLTEMRKEFTDAEWRQEFEAEFIDSGAAVFPCVEEHIKCEPTNSGSPKKKYATGIDLGQSAYCVCVSIDPVPNIARAITRWNRQPWSVNEARCRSHVKRWPGPATVDSTGVGSAPAENLDDIADGFLFTDTTRTRLIRELALAWENEAIHICNDHQLIHELRCMEWEHVGEIPNRHLAAKSTAEYCDCVMALALAWYTRQTRGVDSPIGKSNSFLRFV